MKKIYLYKHHTGFDFFLSDHKIPFKERFCPDCKEADGLIGIYDDKYTLNAKIKELLQAGLDLIEQGVEEI